jgi:hypothetical protein
MKIFRSWIGRACTLVAAVSAKFVAEDDEVKTLVLLDNWATIETHSTLFDHLKNSIGHKVEFAMADVGPSIVKHYDEFYWNNILVMAPSMKESEIASGLKVADMMEFFSAKDHNLLVFGDVDARRHTRKLATQFGVDFENYVSILKHDDDLKSCH